MASPLRDRRCLLLAVCLIAAVITWWCRRDQRTPDERAYTAMQSNFDWLIRSYMFPGRSLLPSQWTLSAETYLIDQISANKQKLLDSGYLTNHLVLPSDYPPGITTSEARIAEVERRLSAAGLGNFFMSYTSTPGTNDEPIWLTCRALELPLVMEALSKPRQTNAPPTALNSTIP